VDESKRLEHAEKLDSSGLDISFDLVGPLPKSPDGHNWVMVSVERNCGFRVNEGMRGKDAKECLRAF
jgi:hypothetical protein